MPKQRKQKPARKKLNYVERSKQVAKERRRRPVVRKIFFFSRISALVLLICGFVWAQYAGKIDDGLAWVRGEFFGGTSSMGLNLENIYVQGADHISEEEIIATILPEDATGKDAYPLFALSMPEMKAKLKTLGWVAAVDIERRLPDSLYIRVTERVPVAIWQHEGTFTLVDKYGESISRDDVKLYPELPLVVGGDAPQAMVLLYELLEHYPQVLSELHSMVLVSARRWNIHLKSGVEIKLPEQDIAKAMETLVSMQQQKQILDRAVKEIDLRDAERVYVLPE